MDRNKLLSTLKLVEPALASKADVDVFSNLCFSETGVTAYNDLIAIRAPLDFPFLGGLPGKTLIKWLATAPTDKINITPHDKSVKLSASRSRVELPLMPPDQFVFVHPSTEGVVTPKATPDFDPFINALEMTALSMGTDVEHLWRMGVTLHFDDDTGVILYASDSFTLASTYCNGLDSKDTAPTPLPPRFVELLISMAKASKMVSLSLKPGEWVEAQFENGVTLWSKAMVEVEVGNFMAAVDSVYEGVEVALAIPADFEDAIKRMRAVLGSTASKQPYADFKLADGILSVSTEVPGASAEEIFAQGDYAPDGKVTLILDQVKRVLPFVTSYSLVDDRGILFQNEDRGFAYFVSGLAE